TRSFVLLVLPAALFAACGGTVEATPDAGNVVKHKPCASSADDASAADASIDVDNGSPSATYPAFTIDAPQVVSSGGPVLAAPKVVPVYFGNDNTSFTGQITTFLEALPKSTYWGPQVT